MKMILLLLIVPHMLVAKTVITDIQTREAKSAKHFAKLVQTSPVEVKLESTPLMTMNQSTESNIDECLMSCSNQCSQSIYVIESNDPGLLTASTDFEFIN